MDLNCRLILDFWPAHSLRIGSGRHIMANNDKVRAAIIGLGFGAEFIPIYQSHANAEIHAICRRNETELGKIGDHFGIANRYTKYEDCLLYTSPSPRDQRGSRMPSSA